MNIEQAKSDVKKIDEAIESNDDFELQKDTYTYITSVYSDLFYSMTGLKNVVNLEDHRRRLDNIMSGIEDNTPLREIPENYVFNLKALKAKLLSSIPNPVNTSPSVIVNNQLTNTNNVDININISFDHVRKQIKAMENTLDDNSIKEILQKISELEEIIESKDNKSTKWKKVSALGKWLFDKSVDVGIALLPLFLKIGQ